MVDSAGDRVVVAQMPGIDDGADAAQRMAMLASKAVLEAIEGYVERSASGTVPVFLAVPSARPGLNRHSIERAVDAVVREIVRSGYKPALTLVEAGHSGGLVALREACGALSQKYGGWALFGGMDSWLEPETLEWLEAEDRLHNAANPYGFIPGEGAGFCVVLNTSRTLSSDTTLEVLGSGVASETVPRRGEEPCLGWGLTTAIQDAIGYLPDTALVDDVFCDFNGEWDRADEYGFAVVRTSGSFVDATAALTPADCWGDVGAATGAQLLALAWQAAKCRWLRGHHLLVWTSSDGPHRAAALIGVVQ
ncbi:hypothetical protein [Pseudorhodoferax sp.]|uniref:hypothetical protein n=1 Tax=Pseudorhodoferax sp. TaxID=1993553 RepID=UPI0039E62B7C